MLPVHRSGSSIGRRAAEQLGDRELRRLRSGGQVLDGDDLGDPQAVAVPRAVHDEVDRLADQAVQRGHRQLVAGVGQLADEAQPGQRLAGRAGVDRGEPLDARRQGEQQRQGLAVADLADDGDVGRHAQEAGDQPAQIDGRAVGAAGRVCIDATLGSGTSASKTSSAMTTRSDGSSSAAQHDSSVVLPEPGAPANTIGQPRPDARTQEPGGLVGQHVALDELVERAERRRR